MGGKGSGRKKESPTHLMSVRVTDHEHNTLRRRAKLEGLSVTEFLKMKCLAGQDELSRQAPPHASENSRTAEGVGCGSGEEKINP
jgi:hypothetical protein